MYELIVNGWDMTMRNGKVKATYGNKEGAIAAFHAEVEMARHERHMERSCYRYEQGENMVVCDYGAWTDFVALTNIALDDLF